ncbi:MAG: hypothetical protein KC560_14790 [Myxococcales bacterium]|nr:hypothetical protein [Myxococcales bacterium]
MAEVSYRSLGFVVDVLARRGVDVAPLLHGLPISVDDASRLRGGFAWSTFAELIRRATVALEPHGGIERAVYEHAEAPLPAWLSPVVRALVRPRDILWMGARWMGRSMWPITRATFEDISRSRVRETIEIPPEYEDVPEFFVAVRGAIRSAPRVLGYADALVDMELQPRRAIYTIELPTRAIAASPRSAPDEEILKAIEEMGAQLDELQATQDALRAINADLEERVRDRTRELLVSRARLEESHRLASLGTLAAGIAHEINNPLAAIQATAQLAQAQQRRDPSHRVEDEVLSRIVDEARRGSRIVRGLLQFARGEPAERWPTQLALVVDRALVVASDLAEQAGVRVVLEPSDASLSVVANPVQLEQALLCLVSNAIEATAPTGAVVVRWARTEAGVRISVVDAGAGIAADVLPRVLEPFFTTRIDEGASGLGLSTAHGIVEQHGGRIEIETAPGAGTSVHVDLPAHSPEP